MGLLTGEENERAMGESMEGYITKNAQKVHRESFYAYRNLSRIQISIIYTHTNFKRLHDLGQYCFSQEPQSNKASLSQGEKKTVLSSWLGKCMRLPKQHRLLLPCVISQNLKVSPDC